MAGRKAAIPKEEIIQQWLKDDEVTFVTLAAKHGVHEETIGRLIRSRVDLKTRQEVTKRKSFLASRKFIIPLPEEEIVSEWLGDPAVTLGTLAAKHNVSPGVIWNLINELVDEDQVKAAKSLKNRHAALKRPKRVRTLPEEEIVKSWLNDPYATTESVGRRYGRCGRTISEVLRRHLTKEQMFSEKMRKQRVWAAETPSPCRIDLPEEEIVKEWIETEVTTITLGEKHGCSYGTIQKVLERHISKHERKEVFRRKNSSAHKGHPRYSRPEFKEKLKEAASRRTPEQKLRLAELGRAALARMDRSPEKHYNWRGGTSKFSNRGPGWKKIRAAILERDEYICQACGQTGNSTCSNLDIHHRERFHSFASHEEANVASNLVTLCDSCHIRVEHGKIPCP